MGGVGGGGEGGWGCIGGVVDRPWGRVRRGGKWAGPCDRRFLRGTFLVCV